MCLQNLGAHLFELGLARQIVEAAAELIGHGASPSRPLADKPHHTRQLFRPDDDDSNDDNEKNLAPADIEHEGF